MMNKTQLFRFTASYSSLNCNRFIIKLPSTTRKNNIYAVDHSKAALRNVMRELDLGESLNGRHNYHRVRCYFQNFFKENRSDRVKINII